jgi:hypothetical protein
MKRDKVRENRVLDATARNQFDKRLAAYLLTAAGVAACAKPSQAEIVFTPTHTHLLGGFYPIDFDHNGKPDFLLHAYLSAYYSSTYNDILKVGGKTGAAVIGLQKGNALSAWDAPRSWSIGPNSPKGFVNVDHGSALMAEAGPKFNPPKGPWVNATNRYLGLEFLINGEVHYGWARLSVSVTFGVVDATLNGYAYETTPNTAILAGDRGTTAQNATASGSKPASGPSLAWLSRGAPALDIWRRSPAASDL